MSNITNITTDFQVKILTDEIEKIKLENIKLKTMLSEAGLHSDSDVISDAEALCTIQIKRLKDISDARDLSKDETDIFDKLHKNLIICKGGIVSNRNKKVDVSKNLSNEELEALVRTNG